MVFCRLRITHKVAFIRVLREDLGEAILPEARGRGRLQNVVSSDSIARRLIPRLSVGSPLGATNNVGRF